MGLLLNGRVVVVLFLGFSSGLPLALSGGTLQAWLTVEGVDIKTIGLFTLVGLPYTLKFLWAPLLDRFVIPFFGRRRGWILTFQVVLLLLMLRIAPALSTGRSSPCAPPWREPHKPSWPSPREAQYLQPSSIAFASSSPKIFFS